MEVIHIFLIEITEILKRSVVIEAKNEEDALMIAEKRYKDESIILDSGDFQEVNFYIERSGNSEY